MLIDFGVQTLSKNQAIHFICLLLRYSRFLVVYAQDHKYNAEEACTAIYMAFCRLVVSIVLRKLLLNRLDCPTPDRVSVVKGAVHLSCP